MSPYFHDLIPLAQDWQEIFQEKYSSQDGVDIDTLLEKTEIFLSHMPPEDPPEIENKHLTKQAKKNALWEASQNLSLPVKHASNLRDVERNVYTMIWFRAWVTSPFLICANIQGFWLDITVTVAFVFASMYIW